MGFLTNLHYTLSAVQLKHMLGLIFKMVNAFHSGKILMCVQLPLFTPAFIDAFDIDQNNGKTCNGVEHAGRR